MNIYLTIDELSVDGMYLSISVQQAFYSGAEQGHVLLKHLRALLWETEAHCPFI